MHKQNKGESKIQGSIISTGRFNIENNVQTEIITEMTLYNLKSIFELTHIGNVSLIQYSI